MVIISSIRIKKNNSNKIDRKNLFELYFLVTDYKVVLTKTIDSQLGVRTFTVGKIIIIISITIMIMMIRMIIIVTIIIMVIIIMKMIIIIMIIIIIIVI